MQLSIDGWTLAAGLVVALISTLTFVSFVLPRLRSFYNRNPALLFVRNSLRLKVLRKESQERGWLRLLKSLVWNRKSVLTYWSFIWVVPLGLSTVFALAYLQLPFMDLVQTGLIRYGWQAQLTVAGLGFIVLIFLLEQISRTEYREGVVQEFFASSGIMPVIYFTLVSSGVVAYLYYYHSPENIDPYYADAAFFIFIGTVLGISYVYYRVARLIFFDPMDEMSVQQIQRGIDLQLRADGRRDTSEELLEEGIPDFVGIGTNRDGRVFMAQELGLDGYIADINLKKLNEVCYEYTDLFDGDEAVTLFLNLNLGDELQPGVDVVAVDELNVSPVDVPGGLADGLSKAIHCSNERPWKDGNRLMERNLDQLGASTRNEINNLNPSGLKNYLDIYADLLQYATHLNQEVIGDYGTTPAPISDLVDHIYREFYQIMEAAGRTGSSDLINTISDEIFRLSLAYHRQGENYLFDKTIKLYASYYRILFSSSATDDDLVGRLLSSMNTILTMLTAALDRANSTEEVEQVGSDVESFYGTLEDILRISIEEEDAQTFHKVWNLGDDDFVMVRPKSEIYELRRRIDRSGDNNWIHLEKRLEFAERQQDLIEKFRSRYEETQDRSKLKRLESRLEMLERQRDLVEKFQTEFEETRFVAAAWAYREVQRGNLPKVVFQEMFNTSINEYSFNKLANGYFQMLTNSRINLLRWESEDADVFKGVQTSLPSTQTWLKEFFCAMGILLLDPEEYDSEDLDERDNPLADLDIDRRSYPDLEEGIQSVFRDDLEVFGVSQRVLEQLEEKQDVFLAFHRQMEVILERREEDFIIESELDVEKVSDFSYNYVSEFEEQFIFRQVLEDLGWLKTQQYGGEVEGFGYNANYPKTAFISDPPIGVIHDVDRRAQNHVNSILDRWLTQAEDSLSEIEVQSHDLLLDEVIESCSRLEERAKTPRAILVSGFRSTDSIKQSEYFVEGFSAHDDGIGGFDYGGSDPIPVYRDSTRNFDVLILAGDGQPVEVREFQRDGQSVYVDIEPVTRDLLEEHNSEELEEMDEKEIREELQFVWLQILYYSEFDAGDGFGAKLTVEE